MQNKIILKQLLSKLNYEQLEELLIKQAKKNLDLKEQILEMEND